MAKVDKQTLIKRSAYTMRTGGDTAKENEKVYLLKHKLVGAECLSCTHFYGNYTGRFHRGCPVEPAHDCLGIPR